MSDVKSRIIQFVKYKNISRRQFLITCGFSESYLNNISKGISYDAIDKISSAFPELSMPWLILGDGSMLKSEKNDPNNDDTEFLKDLIEQLKTEINMLKGENRILRELQGLGERKDRNSESA